MLPLSYNLWARIIVLLTEYPNFLLASCCRVEVVKGADGDFFAGFICTSLTVKSAPMQLFRKSSAWVEEEYFFPSAKKETVLPELSLALNCASTLKLLTAL